jgi:phage N-6-adenine-methyltransferase
VSGNNAGAFQEYQTPPELFAELDDEFGFTLDAAASAENALCPRYFTKDSDGLEQPWHGTVFVNPPYARWQLFRWVEKAHQEAQRGVTSVMLIPASTETEWFHTYCWDRHSQFPRPGVEVRFMLGRPRFIDPRNKAKSPKGWRPLTSVMTVVFWGVSSESTRRT